VDELSKIQFFALLFYVKNLFEIVKFNSISNLYN